MKAVVIAAIVSALVSAAAATATTSKLITGAQIKNGSIGVVDLSASAKQALRGHRGPQGPAGPMGQQGPAGPSGGFDPSKVYSVTSQSVTIVPNEYQTFSVHCTGPDIAISGTASGGDYGTVAAVYVYPSLGLVTVAVRNDGAVNISASATAICAAR